MTVGVIGLGYVGLPLVVAFAEAGEHVVAVDVDERKVTAIEAGESYIEDIPSERLRAVLPQIQAWTHFAPLARTDAVFICVPTPLTPNREPDLEPLIGAGRALGHVVQRGQLVVLESTTYPGTTRERLLPLLERRGLKAGDGLNVAFSPSGSIPAAPTSRCATRRRWWAGSRRTARNERARCTPRSATAWSPSPVPRSRR